MSVQFAPGALELGVWCSGRIQVLGTCGLVSITSAPTNQRFLLSANWQSRLTLNQEIQVRNLAREPYWGVAKLVRRWTLNPGTARSNRASPTIASNSTGVQRAVFQAVQAGSTPVGAAKIMLTLFSKVDYDQISMTRRFHFGINTKATSQVKLTAC